MQTKVLTRHMTHDRLTHNRSKTLTEVSSNTLAMQTSITQGLIHKAKQGIHPVLVAATCTSLALLCMVPVRVCFVHWVLPP